MPQHCPNDIPSRFSGSSMLDKHVSPYTVPGLCIIFACNLQTCFYHSLHHTFCRNTLVSTLFCGMVAYSAQVSIHVTWQALFIPKMLQMPKLKRCCDHIHNHHVATVLCQKSRCLGLSRILQSVWRHPSILVQVTDRDHGRSATPRQPAVLSLVMSK